MKDLAEIIRAENRNKKKDMLDKALRGVELDVHQQEYVNYMIANADGHTVVTLCSILRAVRGVGKITLRMFMSLCEDSIYIIVNDTNGKAEFSGFAGELKNNRDAIMDCKVTEISFDHNHTLSVLVEANES